MTVYESMQKPLQTKESREKLIHAYTDHASLYSGLIKCNSDYKVKGKYSENDCDLLYVQIFRDWKNALNTLIQKNLIKNEYREQLYAVYRYICSFSPRTRRDVLNIIDPEQISDTTLRDGMEKFRWNNIGEFSGWNHIHSNLVKFGLSKRQEIKHRIYINCDSTMTHRICLRFIQKCNERKSAYYFKYDSYGNRDDNVVFYCDTEHLSTYISILREIMHEENMRDRVYAPPICTATIDGWMGYGSEPLQEEGKKDISFHQRREKYIEKCIREESSSWMLSHLNSNVCINGRNIPYKNILITSIVDETVKHYLNNTTNSDYCKRNRGFIYDDLKAIDLRRYVFQYVQKYFNQILDYYKSNKMKSKIEFPFKQGTMSFNQMILEEVRKKQVQFYWDHSPKFQSNLMNKILVSAKEVGIDSDNFACDSYVLKDLGKKQYDSSSNTSGGYVSHRRSKSGYVYVPMTDEEILEARKNLGFK